MTVNATPSIAIIVPTFNERGNIAPIVEQTIRAFGETQIRIVFADDSTDGTTQEIKNLMRLYRCIDILHSSTRRGLAPAVVDALNNVTEEIVIVMDGDLQHPPAVAPRLVAAINKGADFAVASRYAVGGRELGLSNRWRQLASWGSSKLSQTLLPAARKTTDPLSGFFAFRRALITGSRLQPVGFKILLECLVRGDGTLVVDVPYTFDRRLRAASKASIMEGVRFLLHLLRLRWS
jgi:dolichol-phosphate mannosyltransferase